MPTIDGRHLLADLKRLAEFGHYKTGVHRPTYSPDDVASRHWLAARLREAGLDPVIDGIGNVIGYDPEAHRRLLVGSHSETQPHGGWLDGALGVIYGLELARAFAADPDCAGLGVEVAAWADEEGHYSS
jgi:beta-ureidopropionase / N-carbamoyl-L-amino-acid hydrolase